MIKNRYLRGYSLPCSGHVNNHPLPPHPSPPHPPPAPCRQLAPCCCCWGWGWSHRPGRCPSLPHGVFLLLVLLLRPEAVSAALAPRLPPRDTPAVRVSAPLCRGDGIWSRCGVLACLGTPPHTHTPAPRPRVAEHRGITHCCIRSPSLPLPPAPAVPSPSCGRALQWGEGLGRASWVGNCKHVVASWTDSKVSSGNFREELEKDAGGYEGYGRHTPAHQTASQLGNWWLPEALFRV